MPVIPALGIIYLKTIKGGPGQKRRKKKEKKKKKIKVSVSKNVVI